MKHLTVIVILSLISNLLTAQNSFLLYSFKGNVMVTENKTEAKAKVGKLLATDASLKIPQGAAVTLVCNETAMFTLNKAGTYQLSKLGDSCHVNHSSFTSNYIRYVWNQMTKSTGSPGSNRKAFMNTVGAVSRGINNVWVDPRFDTVNYSGIDGVFPLSWKSYADANEFSFFLYSNTDESKPVFTTTVTKLKIPLASFSDQLKAGQTYLWTAAIKGEENEERKVLNVVSKETFASLLETIKTQGAAFEAPAEQAYRIGFMLEDAHYLAEAYDYYSKAATLDPENVLYRSTLMSFRKDYEIK